VPKALLHVDFSCYFLLPQAKIENETNQMIMMRQTILCSSNLPRVAATYLQANRAVLWRVGQKVMNMHSLASASSPASSRSGINSAKLQEIVQCILEDYRQAQKIKVTALLEAPNTVSSATRSVEMNAVTLQESAQRILDEYRQAQ
jgi:hypothetical protein